MDIIPQSIPTYLRASAPTTADLASVGSHWIDESLDRLHVLVDVTGGVASWSEITTAILPMYTGVDAIDPASSTATETAKVNSYSGVIINLTAAGNAQTLGAPTVITAGRTYTVVNNDTSTDNIDIIGASTVTLTPGEAQQFMWDGSAWIHVTGVDADEITYNPAISYLSATNVQSAIDGFAPTATGTAEASRALVPDANIDVTGLREFGLTGDIAMADTKGIIWASTDSILRTAANTMTLSGFTTWDFGAVTTLDFNSNFSFTGGNATFVGATFNGDVSIAGANYRAKVNVSDADRNTSALSSDFIVTFTSLTASRTYTISDEDIASGSATAPRIFHIKDESGNAGTYPIVIATESAQTIDGNTTYTINQDYGTCWIYSNGTNLFTLGG